MLLSNSLTANHTVLGTSKRRCKEDNQMSTSASFVASPFGQSMNELYIKVWLKLFQNVKASLSLALVRCSQHLWNHRVWFQICPGWFTWWACAKPSLWGYCWGLRGWVQEFGGSCRHKSWVCNPGGLWCRWPHDSNGWVLAFSSPNGSHPHWDMFRSDSGCRAWVKCRKCHPCFWSLKHLGISCYLYPWERANKFVSSGQGNCLHVSLYEAWSSTHDAVCSWGSIWLEIR